VNIATAEDMRALGERWSTLFQPGDVIILAGPVGAGKTTLTQGIARGLGVTDPVTSPTFVIAREHMSASGMFIHVDAYRLSTFAELDDLDLVSDLDDAVTVVEWGQGMAEGLARDHLLVSIDRDRSDDVREITISGYGPRWVDVSAFEVRP
jgi:tRNA threonylcarbamoyladenosine biosynthesis protein TsaE